jgi:hypothetical protein
MKIDTSTLLIAGAAAVGVYLLTRPKTVVNPTINPYTGLPYTAATVQAGMYNTQQQSTVAQDIAAGSTALKSLSDLIGNFF